MPLPKGTRYRYTTTSKGTKIRLAFQGNKVIEAFNPKSGAKHTPAEFAADRKNSKLRKAMKA